MHVCIACGLSPTCLPISNLGRPPFPSLSCVVILLQASPNTASQISLEFTQCNPNTAEQALLHTWYNSRQACIAVISSTTCYLHANLLSETLCYMNTTWLGNGVHQPRRFERGASKCQHLHHSRFIFHLCVSEYLRFCCAAQLDTPLKMPYL